MSKSIVVFLLILSFNTFAKDGSSGCGAGWYVLKKNSIISSATRAMINATFSSTIGMTFGTSNCASHSIVKNEKRGIHFIESNYQQLLADMAKGEGLYLNGISEIMGCQDQSAFKKSVQRNFSQLIDETNHQVLYRKIAASCVVI